MPQGINKKRRPLTALLLTLLLSAFISGCAAPKPAAPVVPLMPFTDSAGRTVDIPAHITRVSPSGQLAQMFLLALAPDLLCTTATEYAADDARYIPEDLLSLPMVGQFYGAANLNLEAVAALGPEIVIDVGEPKNSIVQDMDSITQSIAVPAIHITATLDSAPAAFRTLGQVLGREEKAEVLAQYCEKTLAAADDVMTAVAGHKKTALYCIGDAGLNVLAATSYHAEVLDWLTDNMAKVESPAARGSGNEVDLEQILKWNPEVIIFAPNGVYEDVAQDPTWKNLQAIQNGNYYEAPSGPYSWMGMPPSINRYLGMLWLLDLLYPEEISFDLYTEVAGYYELFYGYELSPEEFAGLTAHS